jgi:hypothetical protein
MDLESFVKSSERLATDLLAASERYHIRSDQRDILAYEAATVHAHLALIAQGTPVPDHLRASALLGKWGADHQWQDTELCMRVSAFYDELRRRGLISD